MDHTKPISGRGLSYASAAFIFWSLVQPFFFRALSHVPAFEVVLHRAVWSAVFLALGLGLLGRFLPFRQLSFRLLVRGLIGALLISINWGIYVWTVETGQLFQASFGYYVSPLMSLALGLLFLGERLSRRQALALILAAAGVLLYGLSASYFPWAALVIGGSFALYGLVRKGMPLDGDSALLLEVCLAAPLALLLWFSLIGPNAAPWLIADTGSTALLLLISGPVTLIPLLLYGRAVRLLPLSLIGLLQFIVPSVLFLLSLFPALGFDRGVSLSQVTALALIWLGLSFYIPSLRKRRA